MTIEKFAQKREFLYHLTSSENIPNITDGKVLFSTSKLAEMCNLDDTNGFLRTKRSDLVTIKSDNTMFVIRDQQPISINVLSKGLTDGWSVGDFIHHLNNRVFFWPTIKDLKSHYGRYKNEDIKILRFSTEDIFRLNNDPLFCQYNSGAPRCHPAFKGRCAPRGKDTFRSIEYFDQISRIREVTFETSCRLPVDFEIANEPNGPWAPVTG